MDKPARSGAPRGGRTARSGRAAGLARDHRDHPLPLTRGCKTQQDQRLRQPNLGQSVPEAASTRQPTPPGTSRTTAIWAPCWVPPDASRFDRPSQPGCAPQKPAPMQENACPAALSARLPVQGHNANPHRCPLGQRPGPPCPALSHPCPAAVSLHFAPCGPPFRHRMRPTRFARQPLGLHPMQWLHQALVPRLQQRQTKRRPLSPSRPRQAAPGWMRQQFKRQETTPLQPSQQPAFRAPG